MLDPWLVIDVSFVVTLVSSNVCAVDREVIFPSAVVRLDCAEGTISSLSTSVTTLNSGVASNTSGVSGNATAIANIDTRTTTAEGNITSQGSAITALESSVTAIEANEVTTAGAISSLTTDVSSINGTLSTQATSITQLTTTTGTNTASIQTINTSLDGVEARWEVKTVVGDLVGGVGFLNDGSTTQFMVTADTFAVLDNTGDDINPFFIDSGDVWINSAMIKDAGIQSAKIETLDVGKVTGLNASFLYATITDLHADKITGDVNKLYKTFSDTSVSLVETPSSSVPKIYKEITTVLIPSTSQTRPRYPILFSRASFTGGTSTDEIGIGFYEVDDTITSDSNFTHTQATFVSNLFHLEATWFTTTDGGQNTVAPPTEWLDMTVDRMVRWAVSGGYCWAIVTSTAHTSFPGLNGSTGEQRTVSMSWIYTTGTSTTPTGGFDVYNSAHPVIQRNVSVSPYLTASSAYLFIDGAIQEPVESSVGIATNAAGVTCESIGFDALMVR